MNSKEQIFDILKYNAPTPSMVRDWIDSHLTSINHNHNDWVEIVNDGSLSSIYVKHTKYFDIYVYYHSNDDCTLMTIKFKQTSYIDKIRTDFILNGLDTYVIYCDNMPCDEFILEFQHIYDEFNKHCKRAEYI